MQNPNKNAVHTKDLIADTAVRLFYEFGYEKTTMRRIAEECGIAHSTIFKHYKSKNELAALVVDRYFSSLIKETLSFTETLTEEEREKHYPILYYWGLHYMYIASDKKLSAFSFRFQTHGFDAFFEVVLQYSPRVTREIAGYDYNKKGNDLIFDTKLLARCENVLGEMLHLNQIDVNKAVLYAIKEMSFIEDLGLDIGSDTVEAFLTTHFCEEEFSQRNIFERFLLQ